MGVTEYWRFDPTSNYLSPPLIGERLRDGEYHSLETVTHGDGMVQGQSAVLGLDICALPDGNMRFYDPVSEQWLRTLHESETARQAAEDALREEAAARQSAEDELRQLREQLSALQSGE